jgi:hypothetical protein
VNPGDHGFADLPIINYSFLRDAKRGHASDVWLDLAHLVRAEHFEAFESILAATLIQIAQTRQFVFISGYDELAAYLVWDSMLPAELDHLPDSSHRHPRFGRAGLIVQPRVEYAAVVAGLVFSDGVLFLNYRDFGVGQSLAQAEGRGQTHDAAADYQSFGWISHLLDYRILLWT